MIVLAIVILLGIGLLIAWFLNQPQSQEVVGFQLEITKDLKPEPHPIDSSDTYSEVVVTTIPAPADSEKEEASLVEKPASIEQVQRPTTDSQMLEDYHWCGYRGADGSNEPSEPLPPIRRKKKAKKKTVRKTKKTPTKRKKPGNR